MLSNPKHEAFCRNIANGMRQGDAYECAGYARSPSAASQLQQRPEIAQRIQEMLAEKQEFAESEGDDILNLPSELNRDWLIRTLMQNVSIAQRAQQIAPANKAVEMLAEIIGYSVKGKGSSNNANATHEDAPTGEEKPGLDLNRMSDAVGKLGEILERKDTAQEKTSE